MKATDLLRDEHQAILRMLDVLENICKRLESGQNVVPEHIDRIIEFVRGFADKYHHGKEEDILFPAMEKAGVPREGGPIGCMLSEHDEGRANVRRMHECLEQYKSGDSSAWAGIVKGARGYIDLLRDHIAKEDNILYPMADMNLSKVDQTALLDGCRKVENDRFESGTKQRFLDLLDEFERTYGE